MRPDDEQTVGMFDGAFVGESSSLRREDGTVVDLPVTRWLGASGEIGDRCFDDAVASRCSGPTIDLGCGPGRFLAALALRDIMVLGVDHSRTAIHMARQCGAPALCRSIFDRLPGEGRWHRVLLVDGNVGIDGDPERILGRAASLVAVGGTVLVELTPDIEHVAVDTVRVEAAGEAGPWFRWARVGLLGAERAGARAGLTISTVWEVADRQVAEMVRM
ncbi:class I SAM-dependent methyltransferase [Gordonia soli]|uniref:Methyltransferase type 11 domain-containing protein n=1 Tax=Gordonia soli NBRC 108243 TaxID=1223545 RepID=M0QDQ0_9ACTN|nr:class I SAM-dependent methyltransferase [Gordonia soli]GAC66569.1 hypothetical protein GS4_03_00160 [Gordonia soli NBRC 108243]